MNIHINTQPEIHNKYFFFACVNLLVAIIIMEIGVSSTTQVRAIPVAVDSSTESYYSHDDDHNNNNMLYSSSYPPPAYVLVSRQRNDFDKPASPPQYPSKGQPPPAYDFFKTPQTPPPSYEKNITSRRSWPDSSLIKATAGLMLDEKGTYEKDTYNNNNGPVVNGLLFTTTSSSTLLTEPPPTYYSSTTPTIASTSSSLTFIGKLLIM